MSNLKPTQAEIIQQLTTAFTTIPFNQNLGLKLDNLSDTEVTMSFNMQKHLIGNYLQGILHGGVISSVLDMVGGLLVMASAVQKYPDADMAKLTEVLGKCSTIDMQVSYLNPGKGDNFIAKANLLKRGNKIAFTQMALHNQDNQLIATGSGTYAIG